MMRRNVNQKECLGPLAFTRAAGLGDGEARARGGGHFHMYAYWVCAPGETPNCSPKFPAPEHNIFTNDKK